jgi:hypothetical protein
MNGEGFYIRDGIVVIPKNSVIASSLLSKINRSWTSSPEFIGLREL